jgi:hypothetical protein
MRFGLEKLVPNAYGKNKMIGYSSDYQRFNRVFLLIWQTGRGRRLSLGSRETNNDPYDAAAEIAAPG